MNAGHTEPEARWVRIQRGGEVSVVPEDEFWRLKREYEHTPRRFERVVALAILPVGPVDPVVERA